MLADERIDWSDTYADGEVLWMLTDPLGSVRDIVDNDGDLRRHNVFDSFGRLTDADYYDGDQDPVAANSADAIDELFGYTGRPLDEFTGQQNNLWRWYDAETGTWTSQDPIGFAAGDANLSRYVGNEATTYVDPDGLAPRKDNPFPIKTNPWYSWNLNNYGTDSRIVQTRERKGIHVPQPLKDLGFDCTRGYSDYEALKKANPSRKNMERHHTVNQNDCNKEAFPEQMLQNPANLFWLPEDIHHKISGYYNSKDPIAGGLLVREWISKKSFKEQFEFGIKIIKKYGGGDYLPGGTKYIPIVPK